MTLDYKAYHEDDPNPFDKHPFQDGKKIKDPVTVTITIELEKNKYESAINRHNKHIADTILAFFK